MSGCSVSSYMWHEGPPRARLKLWGRHPAPHSGTRAARPAVEFVVGSEVPWVRVRTTHWLVGVKSDARRGRFVGGDVRGGLSSRLDAVSGGRKRRTSRASVRCLLNEGRSRHCGAHARYEAVPDPSLVRWAARFGLPARADLHEAAIIPEVLTVRSCVSVRRGERPGPDPEGSRLVPYAKARAPGETPKALVAQWIEHRFPKPGVGGSSPPGRSVPRCGTSLHIVALLR